MIKRLRWKFVLINMTIVTLMLGVIFSLLYSFTRMDLENKSIAMMRSIADNPTGQGSPAEQAHQVRLPYFTLQLGQDREIIATGGGYYDLSNQQFLQQVTQAVLDTHGPVGVLEEYNLRYCRVVTPGNQILVFADMTSEQATLENLVYTCVFVGVVSFLTFLGLSVLLARWAVRPVEQAWREQKQFVADASHELKTPLTVITTNAELLQQQGLDENSRERLSGNVLAMARHMRTLLEQMLELAKGDHQQGQSAHTTLDFGELVSGEVLGYEAVFFEQGLELEGRGEEHLTVTGDGVELRQVVDVLLDNARKYSTPGGKTVVELRHTGRRKCVLSVSNPGLQIPPEELAHIFQRFYRGDATRERNGSFGLGLAIAQSIVQRHGGRIWAQSRQGVNTFRVELPTS